MAQVLNFRIIYEENFFASRLSAPQKGHGQQYFPWQLGTKATRGVLEVHKMAFWVV